MSTELQITDELVKDFFKTLFNEGYGEFVTANWEQFKESKQPKPEWEILSYLSSTHPDRYIIDQNHLNWNYAVAKDMDIHSVKRLSDNEVFTIGDKVVYGKGKSSDIIKKIKLGDNQFGPDSPLAPYFSTENSTFGCYIHEINHYKEPLFYTEDKIGIFEGDNVCLLSTDNWLTSYPVKAPQIPFKGDNDQFKYFSSKAAAADFILHNKPLFSLQEIKTIGNVGENNPYYKKLVALAESKLK